MSEDNGNVINLHLNKPSILFDLNITEEDVDTHEYVLGYMEKVQEEIRNTPDITGAFVLTFKEEGSTENWIMGDIKVTLLYTALASIQNEILKIFNGEGEGL